MLNRAAITLRLREPALAWLHAIDDDCTLTLAEANEDSTLYLVPEEAGEREAAAAWVDANWSALFANELASWWEDEAGWPEDLTRELFDEWFEWEFFSVIEDTVGGPLLDEDQDETDEDLGAVLQGPPTAPPDSIAAAVPMDGFTQALFGTMMRWEEAEEDADFELVMAGVLEELYPGLEDWHEHFAMRLRALLDLLDHDELAGYRHEDDDRLLIHPALLHAASEMKVGRNGFFPRRLLVERAEKLRAAEYGDWEWD